MCVSAMEYDVAIIGAGIVGCAAARFLSEFQLRVVVLEAANDVSCEASKANSGILHAGFDCVPGTLKAMLNMQGLDMYYTLAEQLQIPTKPTGSMVVCHDEAGRNKLVELYERGKKNGVEDLAIVDGIRLLNHFEPNLHPSTHAALFAPYSGIISPYEAAIAFAENAAENGVDFVFDAEVVGLALTDDGRFEANTPHGSFCAAVVINTAGLSSAKIHNMMCSTNEEIIPQRGEYHLLDNTQRDLVSRPIFQLPSSLGKGVLVTPTTDGNILLGPTASFSDDSTDTTADGLAEIEAKTAQILSRVPLWDRITSFCGRRAKHKCGDFVISEPLPGFISTLGIDSPGLTAAPAIARRLADMAAERLDPKPNLGFNPQRKSIPRLRHHPPNAQDALIRQNPAYGRIVCRCETVTEAEVLAAIRRKPAATCLDGIKRRTRAQMGRCGGGFCTPILMDVLAREGVVPLDAVTKSGQASELAHGFLGD